VLCNAGEVYRCVVCVIQVRCTGVFNTVEVYRCVCLCVCVIQVRSSLFMHVIQVRCTGVFMHAIQVRCTGVLCVCNTGEV